MKKVINYLFLLFSISLLASCLKDEQVISPEGTHNVVEFGNVSNILSSANNPYRLYVAAFPVSPLDTLVVPINYAGANYASKDITVKLKLDNTVLDSLNNRQFVDDDGNPDPDQFLQPLDPSLYELPESVVIKKGSLGTELLIPIKIDQIDFDASYAIALSITDASGEVISGNFSKIVVNVTPKNDYDGIYVYKMDGWFASTRTVPDAALETTGANTVRGNLFFYYSNTIDYKIDPSTNQVTVVAISGGYAIQNYPESKWDPATKSMHVVYDVLGGHMVEDFTYVGPR